MNFDQAFEELKELADGRYFALQYERVSWGKCGKITAYIEGVGHSAESPNYLGAINNMRVKLGEDIIGESDPAPEAV
jgi:hypothetical protein